MLGSTLQRPAIQALFILCIAFPLALLSAYLYKRLVHSTLSSIHLACLHGLLAALFAYIRRMAIWWRLILFIFPIAIVFVSTWQLPPLLFLSSFVFLRLIFWSTDRSQVPFWPSRLVVWETVAQLLPRNQAIRFIDIGSGFGGLVLYLAWQRPESNIAGIEIAPLPWLCSRMRALAHGYHSHFIRGDYQQLNFADYDVIFAYLSPVAMPALWQKACHEMRAGSLLLSYEFNIDGAQSDIAIQAQAGRPILYGWYIKFSSATP